MSARQVIKGVLAALGMVVAVVSLAVTLNRTVFADVHVGITTYEGSHTCGRSAWTVATNHTAYIGGEYPADMDAIDAVCVPKAEHQIRSAIVPGLVELAASGYLAVWVVSGHRAERRRREKAQRFA